jgi:hypothetical protein
LIPVSDCDQITEEHLLASVNQDIDHIERAQGVNVRTGTPVSIIGIDDLIFQVILIFVIMS